MEAAKLYARLEADFAIDPCRDDWPALRDHAAASDEFKRTSVGLVLDFARTVMYACTVVFPSERVLAELRRRRVADALLITPHPMNGDLRRAQVRSSLPRYELTWLNRQQVSLQALHSALDRDGPCATGRTFAHLIGVMPERLFFRYMEHEAGVVGASPASEFRTLAAIVASAVGHGVDTRPHRKESIERVAMVGGGVTIEAIGEVLDLGVHALITGISVRNAYAEESHRLARAPCMAWIGPAQQSTERFACEALAAHLRGTGVRATCCPDAPGAADMGGRNRAQPV